MDPTILSAVGPAAAAAAASHYLTPDQALPAVSALAAGIGVVLMFGRTIWATAKRLAGRGPTPDDEASFDDALAAEAQPEVGETPS
jgi:hypothetical protein